MEQNFLQSPNMKAWVSGVGLVTTFKMTFMKNINTMKQTKYSITFCNKNWSIPHQKGINIYQHDKNIHTGCVNFKLTNSQKKINIKISKSKSYLLSCFFCFIIIYKKCKIFYIMILKNNHINYCKICVQKKQQTNKIYSRKVF